MKRFGSCICPPSTFSPTWCRQSYLYSYSPISITPILGKCPVSNIFANDAISYVAVMAGAHPSFVCGVGICLCALHPGGSSTSHITLPLHIFSTTVGTTLSLNHPFLFCLQFHSISLWMGCMLAYIFILQYLRLYSCVMSDTDARRYPPVS